MFNFESFLIGEKLTILSSSLSQTLILSKDLDSCGNLSFWLINSLELWCLPSIIKIFVLLFSLGPLRLFDQRRSRIQLHKISWYERLGDLNSNSIVILLSINICVTNKTEKCVNFLRLNSLLFYVFLSRL